MCCDSTRADLRRRRLAFAGAALVFVLAAGSAAAQGARIHMHGDGPYAADGVLVLPPAPGNGAGVLLIPDASGITAGVQAAAQSFSAAGYEVVVLDPNRSGPPDPARSDDDTWADVSAAMTFLSAQSNLRADRLGVIGIGRGARFALRLGATGRVGSVVVEARTTPALALASTRPVLASLVRVADERGRQGPPAPGGAVVTLYPPPDAGVSDDALFKPSDLASVRRAELEFLGRTLTAN